MDVKYLDRLPVDPVHDDVGEWGQTEFAGTFKSAELTAQGKRPKGKNTSVDRSNGGFGQVRIGRI